MYKVSILFLFLFSYILSNDNILTKEEKIYITNHPIITVHNEQNWPPYNFNSGGNPIGFSIDYIRLISQKINLNIKFIKNHTWSEFLVMAKNNKIDVILNIRKTKQREEFLAFTPAYIKSKKSIFTNLPNISYIKDLEGKTVAVPKGYIIHDFLQNNYPNIKLNIQKDTLDCILAVINKNADAIIEDFSVINALMQDNGLSLKYKHIVENNKLPEDMNIAVSKKNIILRNILQKAMNLVSITEINQLKNKWFISNKTEFNNKLTLRERKYLKNRPVIKMCNNQRWEPIEFAKNGDMNNMQGIAIDTLRILENKLHIKFQNIPTKDWTQSQQFLKEKKCDILPAAIKTLEREKYANFTREYLHFPLAIFTTKDRDIISGLDEIMDKTWSRQKGSGLISKLKFEYPNMRVVETKSDKEALRLVNNGKVYFTIATLPVASNVISKYMLTNIQISGYTNMMYNLSMAVRDDDEILLNVLNKALDDISQSDLKVIVKKWLNSVVKEPVTDYNLIFKIFIAMLIISFFILYRQYNLKKVNNNLKEAVFQKTKELQNINNNLENKIQEEITKVKKIEYKLFETEKLAAMGEMIGNIAHQWRQPLSAITTLASGVIIQKQRDVLKDENLINSMEEITKSAKFLSKTIDDFRDLVKGDAKIEILNLSLVIQQCLKIESTIININNINIVIKLNDNINIKTYKNAIIQSMINMINNSKDAFIEKNIETRYIFITTYIENNNAIIKIKDNAGGMPEDMMTRIFEAYFTTKHKSQGTGLGLYITYNMITKNMNSNIKVKNKEFEYKNEKYTGAEFTIIIPIDFK